MKVLFLARRYTDFRNFDSVVRELAARGHHVHLAVERSNPEGLPLARRLAAECPTVSIGEAPGRAGDEWTWVATRLRNGLEYLRYQQRMFDETPMLRERSRERTPGVFVALGDLVGRYARWARRPLSAALRWLERATPGDAGIRAFLDEQRPDVVLITPLINLGSSQIDYQRAARAMGIPTAMCVWSWDHLSSKALIRELPERVFVWNETQRNEAIRLHGVPPDRIVVTGAQCFDKWFGRQPSRDRDTFCREVGLPPEPPYILYVCSAPFIGSQPEAPFVAAWVRRLRESGAPRLRTAPILVRPHPARQGEWATVDMGAFRGVVVWGGSNPVDPRSRNDYFDSLYHSAIVVGLNTSAFIEAGIVGRPVFTILLPEWHENQLGTVHFRYLFEAGGGLLNSATTFEAHLAQLDAALANPSTELRPFVRTFVRPHGLDVPGTPIFVEHVERLAGARPATVAAPRFERLAWRLLNRCAALREDPSWERWTYSERELEGILKMRASRELKAERFAEIKRQRVAEKEAREAQRRLDLERHRAEKKAREHAKHEAGSGTVA